MCLGKQRINKDRIPNISNNKIKKLKSFSENRLKRMPHTSNVEHGQSTEEEQLQEDTNHIT